MILGRSPISSLLHLSKETVLIRLKSKREEIPIGIVNLLSPLGADDSIVDVKQGAYFARGVVKSPLIGK
jgi:hypothetical protein